MNIELHLIDRCRWQPRSPEIDANDLYELACSIRDHGQISPIIVFPVGDRYELVAGERRTRACIALALATEFPQHPLQDWTARLAVIGLNLDAEERTALQRTHATIRADVHTDNDLPALHLIAVLENLARSDLTPLEEAQAFRDLMRDCGWSQRELATRLNKSQGYIAQRLNLLTAEPPVLEALNTRVIGLTEARALAGVPAPLQAALTTWTVQAVQRDNSPATTRQVESMARAVAAFIDPTRWQPNGEHLYTPIQLNRLAWVRWTLTHNNPDPAALIKLARWQPAFGDPRNLLTAQPTSIVQEDAPFQAVLQALGTFLPGQTSLDENWEFYARENYLLCQNCAFGGYRPAGDLRHYDAIHCQQWRTGQRLSPCQHHIPASAGNLACLPVDYYLSQEAHRRGVPVNNNMIIGVSVYLRLIENSLEQQQADAMARKEREKRAHIAPLAEYYNWQQQAAHPEWLAHFQAQACEKCINYRPPYTAQGLPPCEHALNPRFTVSWDRGIPRTPQLGLFLSATGAILPRCEGFTYRQLPPLSRAAGVRLPHDQARRWLEFALACDIDASILTCLPRTITWFWQPGDGKPAPAQLIQTILTRWEALGGDESVATLMDALFSEIHVRRTAKRHTFDLYNPVSGHTETWYTIPFQVREPLEAYWTNIWPNGYPKPWEVAPLPKPLMEVFA